MQQKMASTYKSRADTYLQALERDDLISKLRKQYSQYKIFQSSFDDLRHQINKTERENKQLQMKRTQSLDDYEKKIQKNKSAIQELTNELEDSNQQLTKMLIELCERNVINTKMDEEINKKQDEVQLCESENKKYENYIQEQEDMIMNLRKTLFDLELNKREIQQKNKVKTRIVDDFYGECEDKQAKLQVEEHRKVQLEKDIKLLDEKKIKLLEKSASNKKKHDQITKKENQCQFYTEKLEKKVKDLERQMGNSFSDSILLKEKMNKSLSISKDNSSRLKQIQSVFKENICKLYEKKIQKQQLLGTLSELFKQIEKSMGAITVINEEVAEEQSYHNHLVENLKKSIQKDEQAVKALSRKAALLSMISS